MRNFLFPGKFFSHNKADGAKLFRHNVPFTGGGSLTHCIGIIVYEGGTVS